MSEIDDVLANLPLDDLASRLGSSPAEVEEATRVALPALLGGLGANAQDPAGAGSIAQALGQHSPGLIDGGVNLDEVDATDGDAITGHIFGGQREELVSRLGGVSGGANSDLMRRLLPILAPIVLSYLARQLGGRSGGSAPSGGAVQDVLGSILGGMTKGAGGSGGSAGSILTDILGGVLGGGRR